MLGLLTINKFFVLFFIPAIVMWILFLLYILIFNKKDRIYLKKHKKMFRQEKKFFFISILILVIIFGVLTYLYALSFISEYDKYGYATYQSLAPGYGANTLLGVGIQGVLSFLLAIRLYKYLKKKIDFQTRPILRKMILWIPISNGLGLLSIIICILAYRQMFAYQ